MFHAAIPATARASTSRRAGHAGATECHWRNRWLIAWHLSFDFMLRATYTCSPWKNCHLSLPSYAMPDRGSQPVDERAPADTTPERPAAPRFVMACEAASSPLTARETKVLVRVRDVSTGGIGLVSSRRFERGTILLLEISGSPEAYLPLLTGRVAHVT